MASFNTLLMPVYPCVLSPKLIQQTVGQLSGNSSLTKGQKRPTLTIGAEEPPDDVWWWCNATQYLNIIANRVRAFIASLNLLE